MAKIIIVGGGWAGVSAAVTARKTGAKVQLLERTDLLLGLGNVGGIIPVSLPLPLSRSLLCSQDPFHQ